MSSYKPHVRIIPFHFARVYVDTDKHTYYKYIHVLTHIQSYKHTFQWNRNTFFGTSSWHAFAGLLLCVCVCVREKEKVCLCVCIRTLHAGCQALVMHAQCNNKAHNKNFYYILFSRLLFAYLAAPKPTVPMEQGASACKNGNMPITHIHRFTTTTHTYTHLHIDTWNSLIYMHMYVNRHANAETAKRGVSKPLSVYIWMCVWVL